MDEKVGVEVKMKFAIGKASLYDGKEYEVREFLTLEELREYTRSIKERTIIRFPGCETKSTSDWLDIKDKKDCGEILIYDDYL